MERCRAHLRRCRPATTRAGCPTGHQRRDLGHAACTVPRILGHDNVQASIAIDVADSESRRRHGIRIERMNPTGLAVSERQDSQLRRARP